mgnify:FL=1
MGRWASQTGEGEERQQTGEWSVVCWRGMEGRIWTGGVGKGYFWPD